MGRTLLLAVKREFVTLLSESDELAGIQISFGHPGANELEQEAIWINETVEWNQEVAALTSTFNPLDETIGFAVRFLAAKPGQYTAEEAEDRVVDLFEGAQALVRDTANFSELRAGTAVPGSQLKSIQLVPQQDTPMFDTQGRVSLIDAHLRAKGRI